MLPIPGETYQEYLDRVSQTDEIPYTIQELRDMGWEEIEGGRLWLPQIGGEEPSPLGPTIIEEPEPPPPAEPEEIVTLVTIYFLVWCVDPDTGEVVGPYTQMFDVDWYATDIATIVSIVDQIASNFCKQMLWLDSPKHVSEREIDEYDWEIVSPFGLRYSHGI